MHPYDIFFDTIGPLEEILFMTLTPPLTSGPWLLESRLCARIAKGTAWFNRFS